MKLAMRTMVLQFTLEGPRACTILCFNVVTSVEILTGTFLLVSLSKLYCGLCTVKAKKANKNI